MVRSTKVELTKAATDRWQFSQADREQASALVASILSEIGGAERFADVVQPFAAEFISTDIRQEIESIAAQCSLSEHDVLTANLYYDFVKLLLGCTAFAVPTPDGPIHARNMDWFAQDNCLADFTTVTHFEDRRPFQSVGWPGFVGVFSGLAPGRFAITMNAALSAEPISAGESIAFLIRETLESSEAFTDAVSKLAETPISSDCLMLVTGTENNQMVVIERTPTNHALRHPENGSLIVTNDYRRLHQPTPDVDSPLYSSTCSRFDGVARALQNGIPHNSDECLAILNKHDVRMPITVQQMVMSAQAGELIVRTG